MYHRITKKKIQLCNLKILKYLKKSYDNLKIAKIASYQVIFIQGFDENLKSP